MGHVDAAVDAEPHRLVIRMEDQLVMATWLLRRRHDERWWMTALAAVTFIEQVAPREHRFRVPRGVGLLVMALVRA